MALPRIQYIDAGPALRQASISSATAPGQAMASAGRDIQQAGQQWTQVMGQVREAEEAGKRSTFMLDSSKAATEFQNSLLRRTDYDQWDDDFKTLADDRRAKIGELNLSPDGKAKLTQQYDVWQAREYENLSRTAALKTVTESRAQVAIAWTDAAKKGDRDAMTRLEEEANNLGIPKSDRDKMRKAGEEIILDTETQRLIMDQTEEAEKKLADPAFRKSITPSQLNSYENMLNQQKRENAVGTVESYNQARIDRTLTSKDQIATMFPQASATLRRRLEEDMQQEITQEQRAAIRTPEAQDQFAGRAQALINNYDPMKDDGTYRFDIQQNLKYMEESPAKARLEKQLTDRTRDKNDEWNDRASPYRQQLKDGFDAGVMGYSTTRQPVADLLGDGLLNNRLNLNSVGFTPDQADAILSLGKPGVDKDGKPVETQPVDAKTLNALGVPLKAAEAMASSPGYDSQQQAVKWLWNKRGAPFKAIDPERIKLFEAVKNGEDFIEWPNAEAKAAAEANYGNKVKEFEGWYKNHPDATDEDFQKVVQHLFNPDEQKTFNENVIGVGSGMVLPDKLPPPPK